MSTPPDASAIIYKGRVKRGVIETYTKEEKRIALLLSLNLLFLKNKDTIKLKEVKSQQNNKNTFEEESNHVKRFKSIRC